MVPSRIHAPEHTAHNLVTVLTTQFWLNIANY